MRNTSTTRTLPWLMLLAAFVGCKNDGLIQVEGTVTWNGKVLDNGYVEFFPVDGIGQIVGADIVDQKFSLRTWPGKKRVSVYSHEKVGERPANDRIPFPEPIMHQFVPPQYNAKSSYEVDLSEENRVLTVELTGDKIPYDLNAGTPVMQN